VVEKVDEKKVEKKKVEVKKDDEVELIILFL